VDVYDRAGIPIDPGLTPSVYSDMSGGALWDNVRKARLDAKRDWQGKPLNAEAEREARKRAIIAQLKLVALKKKAATAA
jgi:hypothetical protein